MRGFDKLNKPNLMRLVVGRVIEVALKTPFITPKTMNPFILVMEALITTLFKPETGSDTVIVGIVNTCKSSLK